MRNAIEWNHLKTRIEDSSSLGGTLTLSERNQITSEVKKAKQLFNLGIRGDEVKDIEKVINPMWAHLGNLASFGCRIVIGRERSHDPKSWFVIGS